MVKARTANGELAARRVPLRALPAPSSLKLIPKADWLRMATHEAPILLRLLIDQGSIPHHPLPAIEVLRVVVRGVDLVFGHVRELNLDPRIRVLTGRQQLRLSMKSILPAPELSSSRCNVEE
jgi:hypothetical protein